MDSYPWCCRSWAWLGYGVPGPSIPSNKIIRREHPQLDVVREMHRPHRDPELLRCRGEAASPTAICIIHGVAARSCQQHGDRSSDTVAADDVATHLQQRPAHLGVSPSRDVLDLGELRAHHVVSPEEGNP